MPRKLNPTQTVSCANCGAVFETRHNGRFCPVKQTPGARRKASPCQRVFAKRMEVEGKLLAPFVKAWIAGRGGGHSGSHPVAGKCLTEITSIVRILLEADKAANRPSPIPYVESLFREGYYIDRARRG